MADSSIPKAVAAIGECLIHLRRLRDSLQSYPSWTNNPPDPHRVADVLREVGPQLMQSYSGLQTCKDDALRELRESRDWKRNHGVAVREEPVVAPGASGWFYLSIACEKVEKAVGHVQYAMTATENFEPLPHGNPIAWLELLEDTANEEWTRLINALSMEATDAATQPGGAVADDDSAYVPATTLWREQFDNYKAFKNFLTKHLEIRTRKPGKQRLNIHAGDWAKYWAARNAQRFDALDNAAPPEITSMVVADAAERYNALHAEKTRRAPNGNSAIEALAKRIQAEK